MRLRNAVGKTWGPKPYLMRWVFQGIVLPALTYASMIWGHSDLSPFRPRLQKLNRLAMVGMAHMRQGTPTASLEIMNDLCPLDLLIKMRGVLAFHRLSSKLRTRWDGLGLRKFKGHHRTWTDLIRKMGIEFVEEDKAPRTFTWERQIRYDKGGSVNTITCFLSVVNQSVSRDPAFYCVSWINGKRVTWQGCRYGSFCNATISFIAYIIREISNNFNIRGHTLCFILRKLPENFFTPINYRLSNIELHGLVKDLKHSMDLEVVWRQPDRREREILCEMDRKAHTIDTETAAKMWYPCGTNARLVEAWLREKWATRWREISGHRQSKLWLSTPSSEMAKGFICLERQDLGRAVQFITGHGWLRRHCHVVDSSVDPTCRLCLEDDEEPAHLFWECPAIASERRDILGRTPGLASGVIRSCGGF